jgi:hypothetical protein
MSDRHLLLGAILRSSLSSFVQRCFLELEPGRDFRPNWHIDAITHCLSRVRAGEVTRQIISIPPRHLKTLCVSVAYPAWVLGDDPTRRVLVVAYSDELARIIARQFRQVVESRWYRQTFSSFAIKTSHTDEVMTSLNGFFRVRSINGSVLGTSADLIVIDNPIKAKDVSSRVQRQKVNNLFDNSLYTRLDDKSRGAIVIVMQRLHAEDLVGHVLEQGQDWQVLAIPAIETEDTIYHTGPKEQNVYHRRAGEPIQATRESLEALRRPPDRARQLQLLGPVSAAAGTTGWAGVPAGMDPLLRRAPRRVRLPPGELGYGLHPWRDVRLFGRHLLEPQGARHLSDRRRPR